MKTKITPLNSQKSPAAVVLSICFSVPLPSITWFQGAHSLFVATDLGECITGVMMVKIWGGVTVLMRSWGKMEDREVGLAQVEEGVGYALTRPGLFTFPMW